MSPDETPSCLELDDFVHLVPDKKSSNANFTSYSNTPGESASSSHVIQNASTKYSSGKHFRSFNSDSSTDECPAPGSIVCEAIVHSPPQSFTPENPSTLRNNYSQALVWKMTAGIPRRLIEQFVNVPYLVNMEIVSIRINATLCWIITSWLRTKVIEMEKPLHPRCLGQHRDSPAIRRQVSLPRTLPFGRGKNGRSKIWTKLNRTPGEAAV